MRVAVQLYAAARQAAGDETVRIGLPEGATVADLRRGLLRHCPTLRAWERHLLFAVNHQFAADDQQVQETDEIACFPPVSGG
jgi:molybdopterin converting factor small subunit